MRLKIAHKIALAVIGVAMAAIGTMAWVTSTNLQRGFLNYLNEMQAQDVEQLSTLLAQRYRSEGSFDWLRHRPDAMRDILEQMQLRISAEPEGGRHGRPPPRVDRPPRPDPRGPRPDGDGPPPDARGPEPDGPPGGMPGAGPDPRDDPPPRAAAPPPGARDPMGFASRISIDDAGGQVILGPPDFRGGIVRPIMVDGVEVGKVRLRPLRAAETVQGANVFLRDQVRAIVLLAAVLLVASVLVAVLLARHLLRPVAALRDVTGRIARGDLEARAPLLSRDELADLALHVNAMAAGLQENEQQRRRMVADVAHELRTPITVIRGEIEAVLDGVRQATPEAFESLHAEILRLNKLVDDLHQLALADAAGLSFHWERCVLGELLAPLLQRYRDRAGAAGLALDWDLAATPLAVRADDARLTQVVANLLENSIRYTDRGGRIHVALDADGASARLVVEDSAPGVPAEAHARLFDRLYRVDSARSRAHGGSGLGLAICKALVEAHGGTITAAASPLGGVRITMLLPLAAKGS
ncbi:MAG: ATP-binding protein [Telluria sp.]